MANSYHVGQCRYRRLPSSQKVLCSGLFLLSGVRSGNFNKSSFLPHLYQPLTKTSSSPHFGLLRMIDSCSNDPQYVFLQTCFPNLLKVSNLKKQDTFNPYLPYKQSHQLSRPPSSFRDWFAFEWKFVCKHLFKWSLKKDVFKLGLLWVVVNTLVYFCIWGNN